MFAKAQFNSSLSRIVMSALALVLCVSVMQIAAPVAEASTATSSTSGGAAFVLPGRIVNGESLCDVYVPEVRGLNLTSQRDSQWIAYRPTFNSLNQFGTRQKAYAPAWVYGLATQDRYTKEFRQTLDSRGLGGQRVPGHRFNIFMETGSQVGILDIDLEVRWAVDGKWAYGLTLRNVGRCVHLHLINL